jgi:hypothetical protein
MLIFYAKVMSVATIVQLIYVLTLLPLRGAELAAYMSETQL